MIGFHVYVSSNSMSYADWRDDVNFIPPVDGAGAATFRLGGLEAFDDVHISMKSYDAAGVESAFSNEIVLPAQALCSAGSCNDGNACTSDSCTAGGCMFDPAPLRGTTCNDGNASTFDDVCSAAGVCAGTAGQCNVNADCPASTNPCMGSSVCSNHACVTGAPRADAPTTTAIGSRVSAAPPIGPGITPTLLPMLQAGDEAYARWRTTNVRAQKQFGFTTVVATVPLGDLIQQDLQALRVDGLSALVLVLCGFVGLVSGTYGVGYLRRNEARNLVT